MEEGERWRRTLSITVPAEIVSAERKAAVRKLSGQIRLPGYRAGKVPPGVIEKRFGPALNQELVDRVVGEAYREVLKDRDLRPISEGEVSKVDYDGSSDLSFEVSFEVAPQVEVKVTEGFKVTRPALTVGEAEVDQVLERLRKEEGTWAPAESGTPEKGDRVSVRIQRLADEGDEPRPYEFELGEGEAIPDIESSIQTLEVGGEGDFTVTFPDDFPNEEKRGTSDELRIFLDGRKVLELPELDDAFAARVGAFESLADLRERVQGDLEKEAEEEAESAVRGQLVEQLMAANPFEIPDSMVDQYIRSMLGEDQKLTDEQLAGARAQLGTQAEYGVKRFILLDAFARKAGIEVTADEVDERIEAMAERTKSDPGELYARLQKAGRLEQLEREIHERKIFEALKAGATITEGS